MAGAAKRKAVLEDFARRAQEREIGQTALDYVCDQIASGETFRAICKTAKPALTEDTIRQTMIDEYGKDVFYRRLTEARQRGASSLADKTVEVAEGIDGKDAAAGARVEVHTLQWLAGKWDRETYGDSKQQAPQVHLNFGSLLLQAHRAIEAGQVPALPAETGKDYETVTGAIQDREGGQGVQSGEQGHRQDPQQEGTAEGQGPSADAGGVRQRA